MPTPTTRLRAQLQDPGSNLNVWGQLLNDTGLALLDEAIAGVEKISLTGSTGLLTLTSANYTSDQARNAALIFTGTPTVDVTVTIPSVEKVYLVSNTTGRNVTLTAGGVGVTLAANDRAPIWCDGTDCGFGAVTKQTVNGLIANAQLAPGDLPDQAANAGKFLQTDGSVPLWANVPNPDVGGGADAPITTSVTLANNASVVQSVDMSSNAQSVKLPPATTLTKGGRKFVFLGVGNRTFGVRDNAGTLLTVVPAGGAAELHLRDNTTAAGSWGVTGRGLEPALTLVDYTATSGFTAWEVACRLTDTLSLHFLASSNPYLYAVAADSTPGASSVGTPTFVDGVLVLNSLYHCFRISDTQAIAFWSTTGTVTYKAAVLTVDPATKAVTVGTAASTTVGFLQNVTFTGRPAMAQLTPTLYVVMFEEGGSGNILSLAVSVSGSAVTIGAASAALSATVTGVANSVQACYRISDTQALAIYTDDSGTANAPYSLRAVVLSVSGTTITVGTSAGINDVTLSSSQYFNCQLSPTKYLVVYAPNSNTSISGVAITVSGASVTFGTPLLIASGMPSGTYTAFNDLNANRFQPNLYAIDATRALLTTGASTIPTVSRHYVLTENNGTLTAGPGLFSLWLNEGGGNFPQTPAGFLALNGSADEQSVFSVTINGTALEVTGTFNDIGASFEPTHYHRFGLSGGVCGALAAAAGSSRYGVVQLFRFRPNAPPQFLGILRRNNISGSSAVPVEVAPNKAAFLAGAGLTQPNASSGSAAVRLQIVEFAQ